MPDLQGDHDRPYAFCMAEQRAAALQKLVAVRKLAHADCEPCRVIDGLYVGAQQPRCYSCTMPSQHGCGQGSDSTVCL